ncbi:hypothetical protein KCU64_g11713, partial [Aureobasidium melanogenum]
MAGDSNESSLRSPPWMLCIVEPPEEGWPSITQDSLAGLEKTEAVIELLRHLPYIEPSEDYNTQVAFGTSVIDYREIGKYKVAEGKSFQFIPAGNEEFPPDVVVLTDEGEDYYGSLLLLDTKKGTATDYQPQAPRKKGVPDPEAAPEIWRYSETLPVADLLALWEQKFRSLEWTADLFNVEGGIMLRHDRATDEVRQIHRDHGWPDNFRREECHNALREWNRTIQDRLSQPGNKLHEIIPSLRKITSVLDPQEAYTFLRHHLQDPTATTINKEVEMTGVVPEDPATPRSSVLQHSSQIPSKTVYYPAARPGARLTPITATILGDSGANCQTQFQAGEYYCIGIRPPSPTQSGIAANCNEYQIPKSGDYYAIPGRRVSHEKHYDKEPKKKKRKKRNKDKTYSSRDSHVVTHRSTNLPFNCLCMAERTGCPVFS